MAPHAETPTTETEDIFGGSNGAPRVEYSTESNALTNIPASNSRTSRDSSTNSRISGTGDAILADHRADLDGNAPFDSIDVRYESAYTDGYKEGYTSGYAKSHVELKHQPIAIIGMSCRLPGNVSTPDEFWELLARSRTGFSSIPPERFSKERFHHPNPGKSGTTNAQGGNFLTHDLTVFDAPFFGFTQQEAISLDPQQRLLLECTFEALEGAGIPKHSVVGEDVGVFVGGTFSEYEADLFRDPETIPMHQATGCAMAMQSNRISHFFDFRGPSFTMDTACSSSLVAIHTACQSLRSGESRMAIAAGVHLNILPEFWISYSMSRLFGDAGRSFAFDQRGTGYGRGEGCGLILLKPLDQAIADNDPIRSVIYASGINQDGKTPGITMPNGSAQESLIRSVYRNAKLDPKDTGYVEAHGTGTRVGDPIEVTALHNVFGDERTKRKPLYIGSVKSNIGHLEAAAGIAGVIKTALMLERGFILPNYDFKTPNENIPFDEWGLKVATRQQPWPFGKRWASVNGFGFGGTNAHVVMTRGPLDRKTMKEEIDTQSSQRLFLLSANDRSSTEKTLQDLGIYLERRPEVFQNDLLSNLAYTLGQRKSLHPWRVAISAATSVDLVESLFSGKVIPVREDFEKLEFGWIFTGQGAQWWAMGKELYDQYPVYAAALDKADRILQSIGATFSLLQELSRDESTTRINSAHLSQPACTAIQLALTDLMKSWDVFPTAVAGHSSGEIGAAYAANMITFEDAITIAFHRGRLVPLLKDKYPELDGSMMAVGASQDEINPLLDLIPSELGVARVACINSPASITASGDAPAISKLKELIEQALPGTFARMLQIDTAYHSHHMNLVAKAYTESLLHLQRSRPSTTKFHSSLLGRQLDNSELDASYWVQNLVCPVRFSEAVQSMSSTNDVNYLIELGPHSALQGPIKQIMKHIGPAGAKTGYSSALTRKRHAVQTMHDLAGTLFVKGAQLNIEAINFPTPLERPPRVLTDLPRYAWNHSSTFYHESRLTRIHKFDELPRNDLIGVLAPYANDFELTWRNIIRLTDVPWLRHHEIGGVTVFPISGFIVMVLEAAVQKAHRNGVRCEKLEVTNLDVETPAILTEEDLELNITLARSTNPSEREVLQDFAIRSWSKSKGWLQLCTGSVGILAESIDETDGARLRMMEEAEVASTVARITDNAIFVVDAQNIHTRLNDIGVAYGSTFQGHHDYCASTDGATARISKSNTVADMPQGTESDYVVHPTVLEKLITMYWPIVDATTSLRTVHLPKSIRRLTISRKARDHFEHAHGVRSFCSPDGIVSDSEPNKLSMFAIDNTGRVIVSIDGLLTSPMRSENSGDIQISSRELCYKLDWEVMPEPSHHDIQIHHPNLFNAEIVLVHDGNVEQDELVANLSQHLTVITGTTPASITISSELTDWLDCKGKLCIFLAELSQPILARLQADEFEKLQKLLTTAEGVMWAVRGAYMDCNNPTANMVTGLSRTLRSEGTLMRFVTLDLDPERRDCSAKDMKTILKVFRMAFGSDSKVEETEFMERDGMLLTPRIIDDADLNEYVQNEVDPPTLQEAHFTDLQRPLRGALPCADSMEKLIFEDDSSASSPLCSTEIAIQVKAIGVRLSDVSQSSNRGSSCSGIVTAIGQEVVNIKIGDCVAALLFDTSISTIARVDYRYAIKTFDHMSFEQAAVIPSAYCTAMYTLVEQAKLVEGESLLVQDAASAVGQAAMSVAQMIGAELWATVRSRDQKEMLIREYGIAEDHIWSLSSGAIVESVRSLTDRRGVAVVLNTVSDLTICQYGAQCMATFGRLIQICNGTAAAQNVSLLQSGSAMNVDMSIVAVHCPQILQRTISDVSRLFRCGKIGPVHCLQTCALAELRDLVHAHKSKTVNDMVVLLPRENELVLAPRLADNSRCLRHDGTYILIGGTGGLGRSIARWMFNNGAKHIVLLSRSGALRGRAREQIDALNYAGAEIITRSCDVAVQEEVDNLVLHELKYLPPVRGVVHGAMVLHDVLFEKMTYTQYASVISSKVQGATTFKTALNTVSAPLEFFVCISSAAGAVGNRGQAAYAAANTFLNGFAQSLRRQGINACSIDLTAVSDAGYLAEDAEKAAEVARNLGSDTICEAEVLALIGAGITGKLASCNYHPITGMRLTMQPFWYHDAKFLHLRNKHIASIQNGSFGTQKAVSWTTQFTSATTLVEAESIVVEALVEKIAEVISMEKEALDAKRALSHYPLDSLTAIEVRNFITRMFEANLQVLELLASGSIENLARIVCKKSKIGIKAEGESDARKIEG